MNLKTSFFSKTIFKNDLKRLWWAAILLFFVLFLGTSVPLLNSLEYNFDAYIQVTRMINMFRSVVSVCYVFGIIASVFVSAILYNYMTKANSVSCIHGLPVTRKQLYFTHFISGLVLLIVPYVVNSFVWLRCISYGIDIPMIAKEMYIYIIYTLLAFSITTLMGMVMGNSISQMIFSVCISLLPLLFGAFMNVVAENNLYGFYSQNTFEDFLLKWIYLGPETILTIRGLVYVFMTVVCITGGYLFYKYRNLENHGEIMALPSLKGIFKVVFSICVGILGYFYSLGMWDITGIWIMIPFAVAGLVIAHMLTQKSLSVKGIMPSLCSVVAIILVSFFAVEFDFIGFESRVPKLETIKSVNFLNNYVEERYWKNGEVYEFSEVYKPVFTDEKEIQMFLDMHEHLIEDRDVLAYGNLYSQTPSYVSFEYTLESGNKMYRRYRISEQDALEFLKPIYESWAYKMYEYPYFDNTEKHLKKIVIGEGTVSSGHTFNLGHEITEKILDAMREDRINSTYEQYLSRRNRTLVEIEIYYAKPVKYENGPDVKNWRSVVEINERYSVTVYDTNTLKVLEEYGLIDNIKADFLNEIKSASVYVNTIKPMPNMPERAVSVSDSIIAETQYKYMESSYYAFFDSKEDIERIYDFVMENSGKISVGQEDITSVDVVFNIENYGNTEISESVNLYLSLRDIPEFITQKLKNG